MKTKNDVITRFMERHFSLYKADQKLYNEITNELNGIWHNGFASGEKVANEAYQIGFQDGYDKHDKDWMHKNNLIAKIKVEEYQRGFDIARCTVEADKNVAYQQGVESVINCVHKLKKIPTDERHNLFGFHAVTSIISEFDLNIIDDKIREYEEQQKAKGTNVLTNAQKFAEIFPNVVPFNDSSWWDEPYKEHDNGMA